MELLCIVSDDYETKCFPNYCAENHDDLLVWGERFERAFIPSRKRKPVSST